MIDRPPDPTWRKPAGAFLILALIAFWAGLVGQLAGPVGRLPTLVQAGFYLAAGVGWIWVLPLKRILAWSETGRWRRPG